MSQRIARDERKVKIGDRMAGFLGPVSSSFTLAWLASHRDRLKTLILGGKCLSILLIWDKEGVRKVERTEGEIEALRTIVLGPNGSEYVYAFTGKPSRELVERVAAALAYYWRMTNDDLDDPRNEASAWHIAALTAIQAAQRDDGFRHPEGPA